MATIQVNNVPTFRAYLYDENDKNPTDISTASTLTIKFTDPNDVDYSKTATLTGDGTDGQMQYKAEASFLSVAGTWSWQPYVVFANGDPRHWEIKQFEVEVNLS